MIRSYKNTKKGKNRALGQRIKDKNSKNIIVANLLRDSTEDIENFYRPHTLSDIIGREREKRMIMVMIKSLRKRWEEGSKTALDHILLYGPPGVGKTTMAQAIASDLGVNIVITSGPALEKAADLLGVLTSLKPGDILFIDEIHRLKKSLEEILYPAMEDKKVDIVGGNGDGARTIRLSLEPFTLIGATTRVGLLSAPLRDRFGLSLYLDLLEEQDLIEILGLVVDRDPLIKESSPNALKELAKRSRGTPRIALRLYKRSRDMALAKSQDKLDHKTVLETLDILGIDELGLDYIDRKLLLTIINAFGGGPVGLKTLASALGEDPRTIEDVYEPYLIKAGLLAKTHRGRTATQHCYSHFKIKMLQNPKL